MTNIYDYLEWRGDLSFAQSGFNEVDNLILAWLSYVDFTDIVAEGERPVTIARASELFFETHQPVRRVNPFMFANSTIMATQLLEKLAPTKRFGQLQLVNYITKLSEEISEQFAALTVLLDDKQAYIAFRGTDATFAGWKEDFYMSFMPFVPAQLDALYYLEALEGMEARTLLVGGHSKGGNLAIYASVNANLAVRERITMVYNNDGPGFGDAMLASEAYKHMAGKIKTIIPYSSIVGMLMDREEQYTVVKSAQISLMQHNALNWEVKGTGFVELPSLSASSIFLDRTVKEWLSEVDESQRRIFIDSLFTALEQTGARTFEELNKERMKSAWAIIRSLGGLEPKTRDMLIGVICKLAIAGASNMRAMVLAYGAKWRQNEIDDLTERGDA